MLDPQKSLEQAEAIIDEFAPTVKVIEELIPIHAGKLADLVKEYEKFKPVFEALKATSHIPELATLLEAIDKIVALVPAK